MWFNWCKKKKILHGNSILFHTIQIDKNQRFIIDFNLRREDEKKVLINSFTAIHCLFLDLMMATINFNDKQTISLFQLNLNDGINIYNCLTFLFSANDSVEKCLSAKLKKTVHWACVYVILNQQCKKIIIITTNRKKKMSVSQLYCKIKYDLIWLNLIRLPFS